MNPHTGEAVLRDGNGNETRVIFTEEAVLAVEQALEMGVLELFNRMLSGRCGLGHIQVLVWAGMNAHRSRSGARKPLSPERALKVIRACGGLVGVLPVIVEALTACKALGIEQAGDDDDDEDLDDDDELDPTSGDAGGS